MPPAITIDRLCSFHRRATQKGTSISHKSVLNGMNRKTIKLNILIALYNGISTNQEVTSIEPTQILAELARDT
jgi:hypothetical protein